MRRTCAVHGSHDADPGCVLELDGRVYHVCAAAVEARPVGKQPWRRPEDQIRAQVLAYAMTRPTFTCNDVVEALPSGVSCHTIRSTVANLAKCGALRIVMPRVGNIGASYAYVAGWSRVSRTATARRGRGECVRCGGKPRTGGLCDPCLERHRRASQTRRAA